MILIAKVAIWCGIGIVIGSIAIYLDYMNNVAKDFYLLEED